MRQQHVATPFCSSVLGIPTVTTTYTQTSTPPCVTVTQSTSSVQTVTAVTSSVVYGTTTVYPVVAVSTTSTCEISATYVPASTPPARMAKRAPPPPGSPPPPPQGPPPPPPAGPTPIARPTCLSKYGGAAITSACSCLNIPTPTKAVIATVTLPAKTVCYTMSHIKRTTTNVADHNRHRPNCPSNRDVYLHNHVFHVHLQRHSVLHQHIQRPSPTNGHCVTCRGPERGVWSLQRSGLHRTRHHKLLLLRWRPCYTFAVS